MAASQFEYKGGCKITECKQTNVSSKRILKYKNIDSDYKISIIKSIFVDFVPYKSQHYLIGTSKAQNSAK